MNPKFVQKLAATGFLWALTTLWWGCSAPRDNPLDPESGLYRPPAEGTAALVGRIRSIHISRNFPTTDSYSVMAELGGDMAKDVDSAWVSYIGQPAVSLSFTTSGWWATLFAASYFGDPQLGSVIGRTFMFSAAIGGRVYLAGPAYLFRVIETVPVANSPSHQDTVGVNPELTWQPFEANFPFAYRPSLINITDGFETTVWTSPPLPSTVLSTTIPLSLTPGEYYWTLTVLDSFENTTRSKEAAFVVVQ